MGGKSGGGEPEASKQEEALADIAEKKYNIYEKHYRKLGKDRLYNNRASKRNMNEIKSAVNADRQIANKGALGRIAAQSKGLGRTLGSARTQMEQATQNKGQRVVAGHARANAHEAVKSRARASKLAHIKLGHGLASQTQASLADTAASATSKAISDAQSDLVKSDAFATGLGQFAGGAMAYGGTDGMKDWFGTTNTPTGGFTNGNPHQGE